MRRVAAVLTGSLRSGDIVGRLAGDPLRRCLQMVLEQRRMAFAGLLVLVAIHPTGWRIRRRHPSERNTAYVADQP